MLINNTWGDNVLWTDSNVGYCTDDNCFVWVEINKVDNLNTINTLDAIIDNSDGLDAGKFRATINQSDGYDNRSYLKIAPTVNPV